MKGIVVLVVLLATFGCAATTCRDCVAQSVSRADECLIQYEAAATTAPACASGLLSTADLTSCHFQQGDVFFFFFFFLFFKKNSLFFFFPFTLFTLEFVVSMSLQNVDSFFLKQDVNWLLVWKRVVRSVNWLLVIQQEVLLKLLQPPVFLLLPTLPLLLQLL
jgi:hypothetical protein